MSQSSLNPDDSVEISVRELPTLSSLFQPWMLENSTPEEEERWGWFGHADEYDDATTPEEVLTLREYVEGWGTERAIPVEVAAERLMALDEVWLPCDNTENDCNKGSRIGTMLWDIATEIPRHQPAILELIDAIRAMPELEMTEDQKERFGDEWEKWRDLHMFFNYNWVWGYHRLMEYQFYVDGSEIKDRSGRWNIEGLIGVVAFKAGYLARHQPEFTPDFDVAEHLLVDCSPIDCLDWQRPATNQNISSEILLSAISSVFGTLEQDPWCRVLSQGGEIKGSWDEGHQTFPYLNISVLLMAPYLELASEVIYNFVKHDAVYKKVNQDNHIPYKYPDADLWKGDPWLSLERWNFWIERLRWISTQEELLQRTRDKAKELVLTMEDTESRLG